MKNNKKYGLVFALSLAMGSMIGVGTFFKNATIANKTGSPWLVIATWLIGGFGILATALALTEVTSRNKGNGGIVDWAKTFINKRFSKMTVWFIAMLYVPLTWMPFGYYAAYYTWDIFNIDPTKVAWYWTLALTLFYISWVCVMDMFTIKITNTFQISTMIMKVFPIVFVIALGLFTKTAMSHGLLSAHPTHVHIPNGHGGFMKHSWLGVFLSLPSVLFAFDGFYYVANIRSQMKNPKKILNLTIVLSIVLTVLFYIFLSVAVFTFSDGNVETFVKNAFPGSVWIIKIIEATLVIAVLNALNGFVIANARLVEYSSDCGMLPLQRLLSYKSKKTGIPLGSTLFLCITTIASTLIAFFIGHYLYSNSDYNSDTYTSIYAFVDLLSNWSSVIIMLIIGIIIAGAIYNRISKKIAVDKKRFFIFWAIISSVTLIAIPIFNVGAYFVDIIHTKDHPWSSSTAIYLYVLLIYIGFTFLGLLPIYKENPDIRDHHQKEILVDSALPIAKKLTAEEPEKQPKNKK